MTGRIQLVDSNVVPLLMKLSSLKGVVLSWEAISIINISLFWAITK
jgi:hypothetical protein